MRYTNRRLLYVYSVTSVVAATASWHNQWLFVRHVKLRFSTCCDLLPMPTAITGGAFTCVFLFIRMVSQKLNLLGSLNLHRNVPPWLLEMHLFWSQSSMSRGTKKQFRCGLLWVRASSFGLRLTGADTMDFSKLTLHQAKRLEMESQVHVLELESQLEKERRSLSDLRKTHYQLAAESEGWDQEVCCTNVLHLSTTFCSTSQFYV